MHPGLQRLSRSTASIHLESMEAGIPLSLLGKHRYRTSPPHGSSADDFAGVALLIFGKNAQKNARQA